MRDWKIKVIGSFMLSMTQEKNFIKSYDGNDLEK